MDKLSELLVGVDIDMAIFKNVAFSIILKVVHTYPFSSFPFLFCFFPFLSLFIYP